MVFPLQFPMKKNLLTLTIWDKDLLSSNDYISEATFDFGKEAARAFHKEETVHIMGPEGEKFWVPCSNSKIEAGRVNFGLFIFYISRLSKKA